MTSALIEWWSESEHAHSLSATNIQRAHDLAVHMLRCMRGRS